MKQFVDNQLPNFIEKVNGKAELQKFEDKASRNGLPQVLVFTAKPNTSPLTKYLSTEFRRRLLLAEIMTTKPNKDIIDKYGITDFPAIIVIPPATAAGEDGDGGSASEYGDAGIIRYEGDGFTRNKLHSFLSKHALKNKVLPKKKKEGAGGEEKPKEEEKKKEGVKTEL